MTEKMMVDCLTKELYSPSQGLYLANLDRRLQKIILSEHPELQANDFISNVSLLPYRQTYLKEVIAKANQENDLVRASVFDVTKDREFSRLDVQEQLDQKITFGQKVADGVARFGGSWTFIISFILFMVLWMLWNVIKPFGLTFDAYPLFF